MCKLQAIILFSSLLWTNIVSAKSNTRTLKSGKEKGKKSDKYVSYTETEYPTSTPIPTERDNGYNPNNIFDIDHSDNNTVLTQAPTYLVKVDKKSAPT